MAIVEYDPYEYDLGEDERNRPPVKAFLLYEGNTYYPGEATEDLKCSADTVEELREEVSRRFEADQYDWWKIVQHSNMAIVAEGPEKNR